LKWVKLCPLRPIESEEENEFALKVLLELQSKDQNALTVDEFAYLRVLSSLIRDFEKRTYESIGRLSPCEMLQHLVEEHQLKQVDLIPEFGSQTAVSFALSGKRPLTRDQIDALSARFHVSPAVFFERHADS